MRTVRNMPKVGTAQVQGKEPAMLSPSGQLRHVGDVGLGHEQTDKDTERVKKFSSPPSELNFPKEIFPKGLSLFRTNAVILPH